MFKGTLRDNLVRIKDGAYIINLMTNKVKGYIGCHYILTKIQLFIVILLGLDKFHQKFH